jgi:peptidoglycan/LPS O-acetylase OafA/YrhL
MWLGAISGIILFNSIVHKQSSAILIGNYARNTFIVIIIIYITCVLAGVVPFYHILLSISVGGLLINISNEQYKINVLNKPFFKHLGQISYGVYLLHMFPLFSCREIVDYFHSDSIFIIFMLLAMVITTTYIMAYISYHFLEKPFLRLKDKFAIIKRHKD